MIRWPGRSFRPVTRIRLAFGDLRLNRHRLQLFLVRDRIAYRLLDGRVSAHGADNCAANREHSRVGRSSSACMLARIAPASSRPMRRAPPATFGGRLLCPDPECSCRTAVCRCPEVAVGMARGTSRILYPVAIGASRRPPSRLLSGPTPPRHDENDPLPAQVDLAQQVVERLVRRDGASGSGRSRSMVLRHVEMNAEGTNATEY